MFPPLAYISWITGRPERATYDLGSSDLGDGRVNSGVVPSALEGLADAPEMNLEARVAQEYGVGSENVLVTAGATHANVLAAAAAVELADGSSGVLVEEPGYEPLVKTPQGLGVQVDRFERPAADRYALAADRVDAAATNDTALVTVTNRHNPSGRLETRERLAAVAAVAEEYGAFLLVDEVYAPFVADERATDGAFGGVTATGLPNTVVTGSLTKFHGLGGLRVGWMVGPEPFVERAKRVATHIQALADPGLALAKRAIANDERLSNQSRSKLAANHDTLATFVESRDDLTGDVPQDNAFAILAHERADGDEVASAAWEQGILVVPGRFFDVPERFRLSLGRHPSRVRNGLDAFEDVLDSL